ncbi:MAG: hypothetical protein OEZ43_05380 [Gammaproteobacteria bacterium]|nr:hypothetical protein [Gammaproteobacteria bacterium]
MPRVSVYLIFLLLLCVSEVAFSEEENSKPLNGYFVAYSIGWGTPYGIGAEIGYRKNYFDLNLGAGVNRSHFKLGLGGRLYSHPNRWFSPYLGLNLVLSTRGTLTVSWEEDVDVDYHVYDNIVVHARGGFRASFGKHWETFATVGYGYALIQPRFEYLSGDRIDGTDLLARMLSPGGYEVSLLFLRRY